MVMFSDIWRRYGFVPEAFDIMANKVPEKCVVGYPLLSFICRHVAVSHPFPLLSSFIAKRATIFAPRW
jgi:hypothetical protein